jgi:hypothetical protein
MTLIIEPSILVEGDLALVVSVVVPLMLAVLPYARGRGSTPGLDFYLLCEPICVSLRSKQELT